MSKYSPNTPRTISDIRSELDKIAEAINSQLDKLAPSQTEPSNQMTSNLDMNNFKILNADLSCIRENDPNTYLDYGLVTDTIKDKYDYGSV